MTKKEKELLKEVEEKIDHIVNWDNKNLKKDQYYDLDDCLQIVAGLVKDKRD